MRCLLVGLECMVGEDVELICYVYVCKIQRTNTGYTHLYYTKEVLFKSSAAKLSDFSDSVRFLKALPKTGPKRETSEK